MSYLDQPRINFSGSFQASPATINNTPNNYNPAAYNADSLKPDKIELYWEPKGDSIFDLLNCTVTTVETPGVANDPLVGSGVSTLYTSSPPKLVDLDPMQQNGSEIWGMTVMIGDFSGAYVQGVFSPVAFNGIWGNSQGKNTPRNSASGSAVYQSTLTNLKWNVGSSQTLQKLKALSPNRLSIRMVVSAHNNAPQLYAFTTTTFQLDAGAGSSPGGPGPARQPPALRDERKRQGRARGSGTGLHSHAAVRQLAARAAARAEHGPAVRADDPGGDEAALPAVDRLRHREAAARAAAVRLQLRQAHRLHRALPGWGAHLCRAGAHPGAAVDSGSERAGERVVGPGAAGSRQPHALVDRRPGQLAARAATGAPSVVREARNVVARLLHRLRLHEDVHELRPAYPLLRLGFHRQAVRDAGRH